MRQDLHAEVFPGGVSVTSTKFPDGTPRVDGGRRDAGSIPGRWLDGGLRQYPLGDFLDLSLGYVGM